MPNLTFGGPTPNVPTYANGNPEYSNNNIVDTVTDNLSKVWGSHSIKAGAYIEFNRKVQPCGAAGCNGYTGAYNFAPDTNTPQHGPGYANALLILHQLYGVDGQNHRE
jgi:hypothetical protein